MEKMLTFVTAVYTFVKAKSTGTENIKSEEGSAWYQFREKTSLLKGGCGCHPVEYLRGERDISRQKKGRGKECSTSRAKTGTGKKKNSWSHQRILR